MKTKEIKIKDLKPGMKIKSYDADTREIVFSTVNDVWNTVVKKQDQRHLIFENGAEIHCSNRHPIMVLRETVIQVLPDDLTTDDLIIVDGLPTKLKQCLIDDLDENYIDIEVEGTNLFFAKSINDTNMILTHNCSQGGVRGGAATLYYPIWHLEIEDLLVLKNNKGTEETRVRHLDYGVQFNKLMYERLLAGGDITLFSPKDVPGLYESFFADQDKFRELYTAAERNTKLRKKKIKALDLFSAFMSERKDTGRIYFQNVDHANEHGSFDQNLWPIRQSNLCVEIDLPTRPLQRIDDGATKKRVKVPKEKLTEFLQYKERMGGTLLRDKLKS